MEKKTYPRLIIKWHGRVRAKEVFTVEEPPTIPKPLFKGSYMDCMKFVEKHDERALKTKKR